MAGPISIGASIVGTGLSMFGAQRQAQSTSQMYSYQAAIAAFNKQIDLQNRDFALAQGETQAGQIGMRGAQRYGQIRAAQGASGFDVGSGSNVAVRDSQRMVTQMDEQQIRRNAAQVAYGYEMKAEGEGLQSDLYSHASSDALSAGRLNVMSSLVSGIGSVSSKWMQGSMTGLFWQ